MKYLLRSLLTFLVLYGLVALIADKVYFGHGFSISLGMQIGMAILLFQYLIGPVIIRWVMDIDWNAQLPVRNRQALEALCAREGLPMPKVGIIHGAMPNAFTFGRVQSDASIVVTDGLIEALTPEELDAVIAHEAGHIKHWDFLTITAAAIAPLLLYQIYAFARRWKDDHWAAYAAYAAYWVSEFIVLSLSRTREYWADNFAGRATGNPDALASGLVKICYGMAKVQCENKWAAKHGDVEQKKAALIQSRLAGTIGVMGISTGSAAFALSGPSPEAGAAVMRWDLVNPWARVYELASTHPLTANRVQAMNQLTSSNGQPVSYQIPSTKGIEWSSFPLEIALWAAPWLCGAAVLLTRGEGAIIPAAILLVTWLARIAYRYQGRFESTSILTLLSDTLPSEMRPRAVRIEGEIVGRGEPGAFWSPDLVIKDETGIMFMLDRQSIPLARVVMAQKADRLIGQRVVLEGWYRRGVMPYVELSRITCVEDEDRGHSSYSRWIQMGGAVAGTALLYSLRNFW